jgi:hypothetical protein
MSLAQTNLQLYHQLRELRWDESSLAQVQRAHGFAQRLWSSQYRPSGKTFVSHLVGTASALAHAGEEIHIVQAGLLHAAYDSGDFGSGTLGSCEANREILRACVGPEAEQLVLEYSAFAWWPDGVSALSAMDNALSRSQRALLAMRIANEWDDWLDGGILQSGKRHLAEHEPVATQKMVQLARANGMETLAEGLEDAASSARGLGLSSTSHERMPSASYSLLPASAKLRRTLRQRALRLVRGILSRARLTQQQFKSHVSVGSHDDSFDDTATPGDDPAVAIDADLP